MLRDSIVLSWKVGVHTSHEPTPSGPRVARLSVGKFWSTCVRAGYCVRLPPRFIDTGPNTFV